MSPTQVADILVQIVERRRQRMAEARAKQTFTEPPRRPVVQTAGTNDFLAALSAQRGRAVIAEIKMGSPSLGSLEGRFEPLQQARAYAENGAVALSVVVEPDFFHGSYELLAACTDASGLPAVAKDFIVDPLQLQWAKRAGASAVLLIAALYSYQELKEYARLARSYGMVPLIETHELPDLMKLGDDVWELVGVNNRNLRTFEVEITTSLALLPSLPPGAMKVSESGIHSADAIGTLAGAGFDAYLIGEALLLADDPEAKLAELLS
ncbi:MAG: indole-3-glycerol-phosphate synthase [bacterium]|nr:indole-3-glycerol-phosphate synthase [bacterium]